MTRIKLFIMVLIIYLVYAGFKYRKTWKRLSFWKLIGLFVTFTAIISLSGIVVFYGTRFIEAAVSSDILTFIIQFLAIIIIMIIAAILFMLLSNKITNGIVPIYKDDKKSSTKS